MKLEDAAARARLAAFIAGASGEPVGSLEASPLAGGAIQENWLIRLDLGGARQELVLRTDAASAPGVAAARGAEVLQRTDGTLLGVFTDKWGLRVLQQNRARLDPQTVRMVEANLEVIDAAIIQARRALAADPSNAYLNGHLAEQMTTLVHELMEELRGIRTELTLLRQALENEQRHPAIRPPSAKRTAPRGNKK